MKVEKLFTGESRGQGAIEFILLLGVLAASSVATFGVYSAMTRSSWDAMENSTSAASDKMSASIQEALEEIETPGEASKEALNELSGEGSTEVEEEESKELSSVNSKKDLTKDKCVKVDIGGSAVVKFTVQYKQVVKIHRPSMHLKLSNFCDISVETVTLAVDDRVYWHFEKSFFDHMKEWITRIIGLGKLKNYNHHFYYSNVELVLESGEHEITFRWTGTAYAKKDSSYSGEIRAAVTSKMKKKVAKSISSSIS